MGMGKGRQRTKRKPATMGLSRPCSLRYQSFGAKSFTMIDK